MRFWGSAKKIDRERAGVLAATSKHISEDLEQGEPTELAQGWHFGFRRRPTNPHLVYVGGYTGVIVNKMTGKLFHVGCCVCKHSLELYDLGYQYECCDLIVCDVLDLEASVAALVSMRINYVIREFETGVWWKVPRPVTEEMHREKLAQLPATYENVVLPRVAETLELVRIGKYFKFELRDRS